MIFSRQAKNHGQGLDDLKSMSYIDNTENEFSDTYYIQEVLCHKL